MDFSSLSHKNKTYFNYLSCTFTFFVLKKLITRNTNLFVVTTRSCPRLQISRLVHHWICAPKKRARIANIIYSSRKTLNYSVWLLTIIELHVKNENILADKINIPKKTQNENRNILFCCRQFAAPNVNFRKISCSEDDLRSRIFGTFVVKAWLACLSKDFRTSKTWYNCTFLTDSYPKKVT